MFRGLFENVLSAERLDRLFETHALRQYEKDLLFSTCVDIMALVVSGMHRSVHEVYRQQAEQMTVSVRSLYGKLNHTEPQVCEALVRETACELRSVRQHLGAPPAELLPGYDVRIIDGNHLAGTDHRLKELRETRAAALPGHALPIFDPQQKLVVDVLCCEDGHAQERSLLPHVLEQVKAGQVWIADRNFCTTQFLCGMVARNAYFIIRQHLGSLRWELVGKRKKLGRIETGMVYEQTLRILDAEGQPLLLRRVTVELDQPTRDGETEVSLLSNLPPKVSGLRIGEAYRVRWTMETAFQDLATCLHSEIQTLGYPRAALLGFCVGLLLYNLLSVLQAALQAAHQTEAAISTYDLAGEISGTARGMMMAVPAGHWTAAFAALTPAQLARLLQALAKKVRLPAFLTNPWKPKRPPPKRQSGNRGNHVSTYRVLQQRKTARK